jgi:hypothetical protein
MLALTIAEQLADLDIPFIDSTQVNYDHERTVWNGLIDCRPAFIAQPQTSSQISQLALLAQ